MNPDVAAAIPELVRQGALTPERAAPLLRAARGVLVSLRAELRALLYLGVMLVVGGVSLLVEENLERIGPTAIAVALALAAVACFFWVARRAPAFTWGEAAEAHLGLEYLLLLGVLLAGADLAYVESEFTPLGEHWPWHLLLVALGAGAAAVRYDSRLVWTLALSSFAAWRGVAVGLAAAPSFIGGAQGAVRANAIACGLLFVALGALLARTGRKAHFEPVTVHVGWLLILGGLTAGAATWGEEPWAVWALLLLVVGAALAVWGFRRRRYWLFALGVAAGYAGHARLVADFLTEAVLGCFWFFWTAAAVLGLLVWAHFRLRRPR